VEFLLCITLANADQFALQQTRSRNEDDQDFSVSQIDEFNVLQDGDAYRWSDYDADVLRDCRKHNRTARHPVFRPLAFRNHTADISFLGLGRLWGVGGVTDVKTRALFRWNAARGGVRMPEVSFFL